VLYFGPMPARAGGVGIDDLRHRGLTGTPTAVGCRSVGFTGRVAENPVSGTAPLVVAAGSCQNMIVDCHTQIWDVAAHLGFGSAPANVADAARHIEAVNPVDRAIVLAFKSNYLRKEIPKPVRVGIRPPVFEQADRFCGDRSD